MSDSGVGVDTDQLPDEQRERAYEIERWTVEQNLLLKTNRQVLNACAVWSVEHDAGLVGKLAEAEQRIEAQMKSQLRFADHAQRSYDAQLARTAETAACLDGALAQLAKIRELREELFQAKQAAHIPPSTDPHRRERIVERTTLNRVLRHFDAVLGVPLEGGEQRRWATEDIAAIEHDSAEFAEQIRDIWPDPAGLEGGQR